jgi:hypothetical protein
MDVTKDEDLGWIYLAQDKVQWRALVNTVMKGGEFPDQQNDHSFSRRTPLRAISYKEKLFIIKSLQRSGTFCNKRLVSAINEHQRQRSMQTLR